MPQAGTSKDKDAALKSLFAPPSSLQPDPYGVPLGAAAAKAAASLCFPEFAYALELLSSMKGLGSKAGKGLGGRGEEEGGRGRCRAGQLRGMLDLQDAAAAQEELQAAVLQDADEDGAWMHGCYRGGTGLLCIDVCYTIEAMLAWVLGTCSAGDW